MKRKMTVVFHDEDLYTQLKIEAVRRHTAASDIVADAVREWFESHEDAELLPAIEAAGTEWKEEGIVTEINMEHDEYTWLFTKRRDEIENEGCSYEYDKEKRILKKLCQKELVSKQFFCDEYNYIKRELY